MSKPEGGETGDTAPPTLSYIVSGGKARVWNPDTDDAWIILNEDALVDDTEWR